MALFIGLLSTCCSVQKNASSLEVGVGGFGDKISQWSIGIWVLSVQTSLRALEKPVTVLCQLQAPRKTDKSQSLLSFRTMRGKIFARIG